MHDHPQSVVVDPGKEPIRKLSVIVTYAMIVNVFFVLMEVYTVFYSRIPEHMEHFRYLFVGLEGQASLVPWMWTSVTLAALSLVLLIVPRFRTNDRVLAFTCSIVFLSRWIDKGLGLLVGGFVPSPLGAVTTYVPTLPEISIASAVWAVGFLMITVFYKITLSVRESLAR
jgi:molybdopterin-containing oxidoreductase family membrane subunit